MIRLNFKFILIVISPFVAISLLFADVDSVTSGSPTSWFGGNYLTLDPAYRSPPLPTRKSNGTQFWNPRCEGIIKNDGSYGDRGLKLKKELVGNGRSENLVSVLFGSGAEIDQLSTHCPSFSKLNDDEKLNFWVWTMAILAAHESSCDPTEINTKASNGIAIGEFMTPLEEDGHGPDWRGPGCKPPSHIKKDADRDAWFATEDAQASCAVQILVDHLKGMHHNKSSFITKKKSYWEVLRGDNSNQEFFKDFTPCFK